MADFLIYNKTHWTKTATQAQKDSWTAKSILKFSAVSEKGDIIEIREDNFFVVRNFDKAAFALVQDPTVSVKDVEHYAGAWYREFNVTSKAFTANEWTYKLDIAKSASGKELISGIDIDPTAGRPEIELISNTTDYYTIKFIGETFNDQITRYIAHYASKGALNISHQLNGNEWSITFEKYVKSILVSRTDTHRLITPTEQRNYFLNDLNSNSHPTLNRVIAKNRGSVGVLSYPASQVLVIPNLTITDKAAV